MLDKQFIFIIGAPRSGTTWLQIMLGAHPLICTTVELTLFSYYTKPWIRMWNREAANIAQGRWHAGLPFLWTKDEFYDFLRGFLTKVYERVLETKPQATHILDKHPGYSFDVEDINWLIPKSRFIHIIRDGRDVAVSMMSAKKQVGFGVGTIAEAATEWKRHVLAACIARQYPERYIEVRFEDLYHEPEKTLPYVFEFCNLLPTPEILSEIIEKYRFEKMKANRTTPVNGILMYEGHYRKGTTGNWKQELAPHQQYLFYRIAGDLLIELHYADADWWSTSALQKLLLPIQSVISTRKTIVKTFIREMLGVSLINQIRKGKENSKYPRQTYR